SERREHLLQAVGPPGRRAGDRTDSRRHGGTDPRPRAGLGRGGHRQHGGHRGGGRPGTHPAPCAPRDWPDLVNPVQVDMATDTSILEQDTTAGIAPKRTHANLTATELIEQAVRRGEARFTDHGAVAVETAPHTGRSAKDKFVVDEPESAERIWREKNPPLDSAAFTRLVADVRAHLGEQDEVFVQDLFGGTDPAYRLPVRFYTPNAWHALFVRNMFVRPERSELTGFQPGFTVLHAPEFEADPKRHGCRTSTVIALSFARRLIVIAGTRYAGEMKKSIFTVLNYLLPGQ